MKKNITPNPTNSTIKCCVEACTHHAPTDYCSLNQIQVGACSNAVTQCQNTECASFELDNTGGCR
ncbi:MAG: DUF1540 domain-containing protein [Eubacteriales bacterium]